MAVVAEEKRVATLRRYGLSEPLIRLSCGEELHPRFGVSYKGPPWYVYHGHVRPPRGPAFAPLWEAGEVATGVWRRGSGLEFIEFSFGRPDEYTVLARTEQRFWATAFDFFYECEATPEELRAAGAAVGFRFLDRYLSDRKAAEGGLGTFEAHRAWLRGLVAGIDRQSGGPA